MTKQTRWISLGLLALVGVGIVWMAVRPKNESVPDIRGGETAVGDSAMPQEGAAAESSDQARNDKSAPAKNQASNRVDAVNGHVDMGQQGTVAGAASQEQGAPAAAAPQAPKESRVCESRALKSDEKNPNRYALNEITLAKLPKEFEAASLCLRVNGTPVKYEYDAKQKTLRFGRVAKSSAPVELSYCMGRKNCDLECKIPRDEFMEALVGQTGLAGDEEQNAAGWESAGAASKEEQELDRELASMNGALEGPKAKGTNASWTMASEGADCAKAHETVAKK